MIIQTKDMNGPARAAYMRSERIPLPMNRHDCFVTGKTIVDGVISLLDDPERMKALSERGKQIMGSRGGSKIIAREMKDFLETGKILSNG